MQQSAANTPPRIDRGGAGENTHEQFNSVPKTAQLLLDRHDALWKDGVKYCSRCRRRPTVTTVLGKPLFRCQQCIGGAHNRSKSVCAHCEKAPRENGLSRCAPCQRKRLELEHRIRCLNGQFNARSKYFGTRVLGRPQWETPFGKTFVQFK